MRGPEASAQLDDAGQDLERHGTGIAGRHGLAETDVAGAAARSGVGLAEVRDEGPMAADGVLTERVHLAELA